MIAKATVNTPKGEKLDEAMMQRYLTYCSGLVALLGKASVLYCEDVGDNEIMARGENVEQLAGNITAKLWAKQTILQIGVTSRIAALAPAKEAQRA